MSPRELFEHAWQWLRKKRQKERCLALFHYDDICQIFRGSLPSEKYLRVAFRSLRAQLTQTPRLNDKVNAYLMEQMRKVLGEGS